MITIRYKLPNYPENQFFSFEGSSIADFDEVKSITTEWLNESFDVQNIYSETKRYTFRAKETEFLALQKLKYAYEIYVNENSEWTKYKFKDIEIEEIFGGFKEITIYFKNAKNTISNKILNSDKADTLSFYIGGISATNEYDLYLAPLKNQNTERNLVDDFDSQIIDYTKQKIYFSVRLFLNESDYFDFMDAVNSMTSESYIKLLTETNKFTYIEITNQENIGTDLYQIDINLISEKNINTFF